jgi:hypothetical protein
MEIGVYLNYTCFIVQTLTDVFVYYLLGVVLPVVVAGGLRALNEVVTVTTRASHW